MCIFSQNWDFTICIIKHMYIHIICCCLAISHVQIFCNTMDCRLFCPWDFPGKNTGVGCHFPLQGIFPTQGLNPGLLHWQVDSLPPSEGKVEVKVTQLCQTLCDSMDYTVHEILQARELEWVAIPFSRGSLQPRDRTQVFCIPGRFSTSWAWEDTHIY